MSKKAVDTCPIALKYVSDWFVTPKLHKIIDNADLGEIIIWLKVYEKRKLCKKEII